MKLRVCMLAAAALSACGTPQRLPVAISRCDAVQTAHGYSVTARVANRATKPISTIALAVDFYRNFTYKRIAASTRLARELDPGTSREISFEAAAAGVEGQAMRCFATHVGFLDGTSLDVPAEH